MTIGRLSLSLSLWIGLALASLCNGQGLCAFQPFPLLEPDYTGKLVRDFSPFSQELDAYTAETRTAREELVHGKTIPQLQTLMDSGELNSLQLVVHYLDRIQRYDVDKLNSVLELNPEALEIAQVLDEERAMGNLRGPMHGIPVLLKDNIATGDDLHTSAGSAAMFGWDPDRDAFLVAQLRAAGAIILGKANLSEWANYMDPCMPNGFSTNGGQTRNPYGPFDTLGSSSGSAVSVAADLVTVSVGSETQGSIIMPAKFNSAVALKTSRGLVSGDYIIPLLPWQDVAGPMGRTVMDVATLLGAMTGVDANDPNTQASVNLTTVDFTQSLQATSGLRVGIVTDTEESVRGIYEALNISLTEEEFATVFEPYVESNAEARATGEILSAAGMTVVEIPSDLLPGRLDVGPALEYGFREALNEFLSANGGPFASLSEIVDYNLEDPANRAPYSQGYLENSVNPSLTSAEYNSIRESNQAQARDAIDKLFMDQNIDVIVSELSQLYAPAGYPALTVPSGYDETGHPLSVVFVGGFMSEPQLLSVGYAYEQATQAYTAPDLEAELWSQTGCAACSPVEFCFSPEGCAFRNGSADSWTGGGAICNEIALSCEECFTDSPCHVGKASPGDDSSASSASEGSEDSSTSSASGIGSSDDSSTASTSGSTSLVLSSVWAMLVAGLIAAPCT